MIKRAALVLATLVAGFVGAIAIATPAQAASCPGGLICWYDLSNWTGPKYTVATGTLSPNTCYNMGTDPNTGINWNDVIDSIWWNGIVVPETTHAMFFGNPGCSSPSAYITNVKADGVPANQMQSCNEAWGIWNGPCGGVGSQRISSWKFWY